MAKKPTAIGWCDYTVNPYGWHCTPVSPGCKHCYMFASVKRYGHEDPRKGFSTRFIKAYQELKAIPAGTSVFLNDMSDTYYEKADTEDIQEVHEMVASRPDCSFVITTKRPRRALELSHLLEWPENLWLMVTVESEKELGRIQVALATPAAHVAVSAEPLLGSLVADGNHQFGVNLMRYHKLDDPYGYYWKDRKVEWIITGGESGPYRRDADPVWFREIRDFCQREGIAFFHKQGNARQQGRDRLLDGRTWDEIPQGYHLAKLAQLER